MRRALALGGLLTVLAGFYVWTAMTSAPRPSPPPDVEALTTKDAYNLMADGFLHGSVSLPVEAPRALQRLADPYDPEANARFRQGGLHDLAYWDGRLYTSWGPAPALLMHVPLNVAGVEISPRGAVLVFGLLALVLGTATFLVLVGRLAPRTPEWMRLLGVTVIATGSVVPYMLRRPDVYEIAITAGLAFLLAAMLVLARAAIGRRPSARAAITASALVGIAFASRPTFAVGAVLLAAVAWRERDRRLAVALLGPFGAIVALYLAFNVARFGSPGEFGHQLVLAGENQVERDYYDLSYLAPGLWSYLVAPPRLTLQFPFFFLPPPTEYPGRPPAIFTTDRMGGAFATLPVLWLLVLAPRLRGEARGVVVALVGMGWLVVGWLAFAMWFTQGRYQGDFAALLLLAALVTWVVLAATRRAVAIAGTVLATVGMVIGVATSIVGPDYALPETRPKLQDRLERVFSPLPTLAATLAGRPLLVSVDHDPEGLMPSWRRVSADGTDAFVGLRTRMDIVSPGTRNAVLEFSARSGPIALQPGQAATVFVAAAGQAAVGVAADGTRQRVSLRLRRGLNRVDVGFRISPPPAPDDPRAVSPLRLADVRVRAAP